MFRFLIAAAGAFLATPLLAQTTEEFAWIPISYDAFEPSETGIGLLYGVPESDFVILRALCLNPGAGETQIYAEFTAALGDAVEGQPILIEFEGLTGGLPVISGHAMGVGAEMGVTGARIELPVSDRLWTHLAQAETIQYGVRGLENWTVFEGAPAQFARFQSECAAFGTAPVPATSESPSATSTLPGPGFDATTGIAACSDETLALSTDDGEAMDLTIENRGTADLRVFWMDTSGARVEMGLLPAGQSATLGTRQSHVWMIADANGTCLELRNAAGGDITFGAAPRADGK